MPHFPFDAWLRRLMSRTPLRESRQFQRTVHQLLRRSGFSNLSVWYHPQYRLPISGFEAVSGAEPRRADLAAWFLADTGLVRTQDLRTPERVRYSDLARVHSASLLDSIHDPETLARVFAASATELRVDEVMSSVRFAAGGTLGAAHEVLRTRGTSLNLSGGFHHAEPSKASGYCPVNDIAVAIAVLRSEGFTKPVVVLDLDAHPPDGTAACLARDPDAWIGSISGTDWGALPGRVDETVIPKAQDTLYLRTLEGLLSRMPRAGLAFVLAGGDVLAHDRHGGLALTLNGALHRDEKVLSALHGVPSVWLPAGGYSVNAWRVLAGTALVLAHSPVPHAPRLYDPLDRRFTLVARTLRKEDLARSGDIILDDIAEDLRLIPRRRAVLLDYYTSEGIEFALEQYGVLDHLRRLGFESFEVVITSAEGGDRAQLFGRWGSRTERDLLVELVVEKKNIEGEWMLYVHWLTLRNPRAHFDTERPQLPGQEVPGLGLAREFSSMLARMAERLGLVGVAFTPGHYHMAFAARESARFVSNERQKRFEALVRDLSGLSLSEATQAVAEGRVLCNGQVYHWEATDMVRRLRPMRKESEVESERDEGEWRFTVQEGHTP